MKTVKFSSIDELAYDMVQHAESGKDITAVMFYEDAGKLLKELLAFSNVKPGFIELEDSAYDGYEKEYYISLISEIDCKEFSIFVEKAYKSGLGFNRDKTGYLFTDCDIAYLHGEVHSSIIPQIYAKKIFEVDFVGGFDFDDKECEKENPFDEKKDELYLEKKNTSSKPPITIDIDISATIEEDGEAIRRGDPILSFPWLFAERWSIAGNRGIERVRGRGTSGAERSRRQLPCAREGVAAGPDPGRDG